MLVEIEYYCAADKLADKDIDSTNRLASLLDRAMDENIIGQITTVYYLC
jgi:hypothetical protein